MGFGPWNGPLFLSHPCLRTGPLDGGLLSPRGPGVRVDHLVVLTCIRRRRIGGDVFTWR
jgi:hypothetical protein